MIETVHVNESPSSGERRWPLPGPGSAAKVAPERQRWRNPWANLGMVTLAAFGMLFLRVLPDHRGHLAVHGMYDEVGHLLTAFIFAVAVRSIRMPVPVWAMLVGGVMLDLGHIPDELGVTRTIAGSSRNGGHSLLVVTLIATVALVDRRHGSVWLGLAIGALSHLWRDMGTGTVPLGWPLTRTVQGVSYGTYTGVIVLFAAVLIGLGWSHILGTRMWRRHRQKHCPR